MRHFLLTLDYELYGDGSGDVFRHVIEPTNQMMQFFDEYNVKVTVFVEMVEFLRMRQEWDKGNDMGYGLSPFEAVVKQIQDIYRRGHDVQLHIHPQWVDAKYSDGKWQVDNDNWILGAFDHVGDVTLEAMLLSCKNELEAILRDVDPTYQCLALRAGGYNVQPSQRLVQAMRSVGLKIDSSVVPGAVMQGARARYDFSNCDSKLNYWNVDDTIERPALNATDLYELPLASMPLCRFLKLCSWARVKSILKNSRSAKESFDDRTSMARGNSFLLKVKYLFESECVTWDFCLMHRTLHRRFLRITRDRSVVVLVGHPKGFSSIDTVKSLVNLTGSDVTFRTVAELYHIMDNRNEPSS